ncbi:hypothetical protein [Streptomyces antibioticus]|uniref:hypothetical protein n=1 Tax=Streptomyces antibioticus TaxID=1890 RepID=UPI003D721CCE
MGWQEAVIWGAFGGFAMEALDFVRAVRWHRTLPWKVESSSIGPGPAVLRPQRQIDVRPGEENLPAPGLPAYCVAALLRVVVGGGVAAGIAASPPHAVTPWIAMIVGAGALTVLEKITSLVPLIVQLGKDAVIGMVEQQQAQQAQTQQGQPIQPATAGNPQNQQGVPPQQNQQPDVASGPGGVV